jgi:hypothetical protein
MADILSQEEIDALLDVVEDEGDNVLDTGDDNLLPQRQVTLYDFKRPNRVSKEQLRAFRGVHDKMARSLASQISAIMRSIVEIQLHSVDQMTYGEFLMSLPNPTSFNVFSVKPLEGSGVIEINPSIAFPMLDRLLGGKGEPEDRYLEFRFIGTGDIPGETGLEARYRRSAGPLGLSSIGAGSTAMAHAGGVGGDTGSVFRGASGRSVAVGSGARTGPDTRL